MCCWLCDKEMPASGSSRGGGGGQIPLSSFDAPRDPRKVASAAFSSSESAVPFTTGPLHTHLRMRSEWRRVSPLQVCPLCAGMLLRQVRVSDGTADPTAVSESVCYAPLGEVLEWVQQQRIATRRASAPACFDHSIAFLYFLRLYVLLHARVERALSDSHSGSPTGAEYEDRGLRIVDHAVSSCVHLLQRSLFLDAEESEGRAAGGEGGGGWRASLLPHERHILLCAWRQLEHKYVLHRCRCDCVFFSLQKPQHTPWTS